MPTDGVPQSKSDPRDRTNAIDLITIVGWAPDAKAAKADTFKVPVTDDLIRQLACRRLDLAGTNCDRLDDLATRIHPNDAE